MAPAEFLFFPELLHYDQGSTDRAVLNSPKCKKDPILLACGAPEMGVFGALVSAAVRPGILWEGRFGEISQP